MKTKVFISTDGPLNAQLTSFFAQHDWVCISQSLIKFDGIFAKESKPYDVIFFSSTRSYDYYISSNIVNENALIATIGKSTSNYLKNKFSSIDFIGENSGSPKKVAQEFLNWLGTRNVLFPLSVQSKETIAQRIPETQKEIIHVYNTLFDLREIKPCDFYVFTSPSNLMSFLERNELPKHSKVIAWGETTKAACMEKQVQVYHTLLQSSQEALFNFFNENAL